MNNSLNITSIKILFKFSYNAKILMASNLINRINQSYCISSCTRNVKRVNIFKSMASNWPKGNLPVLEKMLCTDQKELITVVFITKDGKPIEVQGKEGENALFLAQRHGIEMEGACEASLACTTCHVYVKDKYFDQLPEAEEKEEDLLDMAPFLKPNSRLGCQIILKKEMNGIELTLPQATRNFYVDGHKPTPH